MNDGSLRDSVSMREKDLGGAGIELTSRYFFGDTAEVQLTWEFRSWTLLTHLCCND